MKNIHILPTDKPSRLSKQLDNPLVLYKQFIENRKFGRWSINQNIYITSDEEVKEGDWVYCTERKLFGKVVEIQLAKQILDTSMLYFEINDEEIWCKLFNCKKIILTTDQDLIDVQAIDDEFLEWFVKNPSCDNVEVIYEPKNYLDVKKGWEHSLIIPKEEPKQETLEEVSERYANMQEDVSETIGKYLVKAVFKDGAYWNQERSYSEQEVVNILMKVYEDIGKRKIPNPVVLAEWFNKFKKL